MFFHPKEQNSAKAVAQCKAQGKAALAIKPAKVVPPARIFRPYVDCRADAKDLPLRPACRLLGFFQHSAFKEDGDACAGLAASSLSADMCFGTEDPPLPPPLCPPLYPPQCPPRCPLPSPALSPLPLPHPPQLTPPPRRRPSPLLS
jgi:hypothetical protein